MVNIIIMPSIITARTNKQYSFSTLSRYVKNHVKIFKRKSPPGISRMEDVRKLVEPVVPLRKANREFYRELRWKDGKYKEEPRPLGTAKK